MQKVVSPKTIADITLFRGLPEVIIDAIAQRARLVELAAGEVLFHQGDPADALYRLEEGQLHITRHYDDNESFVLATMTPYELVGEMSMLANQTRAVTATAVADCVLIGIEKQDLMEIAEQYPTLALHLLHETSKQLAKLHLNVHEYAIGQSSADARLASLLLLMSDNQVGNATNQIHKHQMARAIGVDFVWLDTKLNDWAIEGYIAVRGSAIEVMNVAALQQIAGMD